MKSAQFKLGASLELIRLCEFDKAEATNPGIGAGELPILPRWTTLAKALDAQKT